MHLAYLQHTKEQLGSTTKQVLKALGADNPKAGLRAIRCSCCIYLAGFDTLAAKKQVL